MSAQIKKLFNLKSCLESKNIKINTNKNTVVKHDIKKFDFY